MTSRVPKWKRAWDRKNSRYVQDYEAKHYIWTPKRNEALDLFPYLKAIYCPTASRFLDLGAGPGAVSLRLLAEAPGMKATLVDGSKIQVQAARKRFRKERRRCRLVLRDLNDPNWLRGLGRGFPLIVSNIAIHHLPDRRKTRLFREIHDLLAPNGLFIYCDMVKFNDPSDEDNAYEIWNHDIRAKFVEKGIELRTIEWMKQKLIDAIHEQGDKPATIDFNIKSLRRAGFRRVTLVWFYVKIALFVGIR